MKTHRWALVSFLAAIVCFPALAARETPEIKPRSDGGFDVSWDNGCVVQLDARRNVKDRSSSCSRDQVGSSIEALKRYQREQGDGGSDAGGRHSDQEEPEVVKRSDGRIEVHWENGCEVLFSRTGRLEDKNRSCSEKQVNHARRKVDTPEVRQVSEHVLEVTFMTECTITFKRSGEMEHAGWECSDAQKSRAREAVQQHRREHGRD